jgi:hypothetical protein
MLRRQSGAFRPFPFNNCYSSFANRKHGSEHQSFNCAVSFEFAAKGVRLGNEMFNISLPSLTPVIGR